MKPRAVILLVEDNPGDIFLVRQALLTHQIDCELLVAEDGDRVTELLQRMGDDLPAPDLLLMDLNLPRVEAPELFRRVRANYHCSHTPLIVVSSSDSAADRAWTSAFGVTHYFRKPSDLNQFLTLGMLVKQVLQHPEKQQFA